MEKYIKYVIPTMYIGIIGVMIMCFCLIIAGIKNYALEKENINYTIDNVFEDVIPVVKTQSDEIIKPYLSDNVIIGKSYYDFESNETSQEESIIFYEGIYLQNNGVDYVLDDSFDVVSVLDGEIISIEDDEVYGNRITIKHTDNLMTIYSNVKDVLPSIGYKVSQGEIIGSSDSYKLSEKDMSLLHFEVYFKGKSIDPENLYTLSVSELK